jgi:hypothetical protein
MTSLLPLLGLHICPLAPTACSVRCILPPLHGWVSIRLIPACS